MIVADCCLDCKFGFEHEEYNQGNDKDAKIRCQWLNEAVFGAPRELHDHILAIPDICDITRNHFIMNCLGYVAGNSVPRTQQKRRRSD